MPANLANSLDCDNDASVTHTVIIHGPEWTDAKPWNDNLVAALVKYGWIVKRVAPTTWEANHVAIPRGTA